MIYGTGYANRQVYKNKSFATVIFVAGNTPYKIKQRDTSLYACQVSDAPMYTIRMRNTSKYTITVDNHKD